MDEITRIFLIKGLGPRTTSSPVFGHFRCRPEYRPVNHADGEPEGLGLDSHLALANKCIRVCNLGSAGLEDSAHTWS